MVPDPDGHLSNSDGGVPVGGGDLKVILSASLKDWFFCPAALWTRQHDPNKYPFTKQAQNGETYTDTRQVVIELESESVQGLTRGLQGFVEDLDPEEGYTEEDPIPTLSLEWGCVSHLTELSQSGMGWVVVKRLTTPRTFISRFIRFGLAVQLKALEESGLEPGGAVVVCPHPDHLDQVQEHVLLWDERWKDDTAKEVQRIWALINGWQPEMGVWTRCDSCAIESCYALDYLLTTRTPLSPHPIEVTF